MSSAIELRQWLNRTDKDFVTKLSFGIKAWQSIEFVLITKHEVITEEFCSNLRKFHKEVKRTSAGYEAVWKIINEFLALKCSAGAIGSSTKELLVNTLRAEANITIGQPNVAVFEGLQLTMHNAAMQNYYKSNPKAYAGFVGTNVKYLIALLAQESQNWLETQIDAIKVLIAAIKSFVKHTPLLDQFQVAFSAKVYVPFVELFVSLRHRKYDLTAEFFAIVQELYLSSDSASAELKQCLLRQKTNTKFESILMGPVHSFLMLIESILIGFRLDNEIQVLLHKFVFEHCFGGSDDRFISPGNKLTAGTYYLQLLRKHEISMAINIESGKALIYFGKQVQELVEANFETSLSDSLRLLIAALELDPMLLEHSLFPIFVKCMLTRKDDAALELYKEFSCLIIDIYRRLSRAEKFVSQLYRSLWERLSSFKLSKKIKRKSMVTDGAHTKKAKGIDGEATLNGETCTENQASKYLKLLQEAFSKSKTAETSTGEADIWSDIAFAWPVQVGDAFAKLISGLVSKPSLVVWKTLVFTLTDFIHLVRDGNIDENTVFVVELISAMMCQYFAGCRLAEHSDQSWDFIEENRRLIYTMLKEFGAAILSQEHNIRTMNAFLKICHKVGAFDLLCWYYCPDSMNGNAQYPDLPALDGSKLVDTLHGYLIEQEWTLIEQRITNFGRNECKANLNRLYMQRLKASMLFRRQSKPNSVQNHLLSTTMTDLEQLSEILRDSDTNVLFVQNLSHQEMTEVCEVLLDAEQSQQLAANVWHRKDFAEVLYVSIFKRLTDAFASKRSILVNIDFDAMLSGDEFQAETGNVVKALIAHLDSTDELKIKKFSKEAIAKWVEFLAALPVKFISNERKDVLVLMTFALYCNVKGTANVELISATHSLVKAFFHFGDAPNIFAHISVSHVSKVLDCTTEAGKEIWNLIFDKATKHQTPLNIEMFGTLLELFIVSNYDDSILDVCLLLVQHLSKDKNCKDHYNQYRTAILAKISEYFSSKNTKNTEKNKEFVRRTLSGFVTVISTTLSKFEDVNADQATSLRIIFKTYLKESINSNDPHSIKLLSLALSHKLVLLFTDDEIHLTINLFWSDLMMTLKNGPSGGLEHLELFLKTILNSKTDLEFIELLTDDNTNDTNLVENFCSFQHELFGNIAKCQLTRTKGSIFNEFYKQISFRIILSLRRDSPNLVQSMDALLKLLECHRRVCSNGQLPVSTLFVDDTLSLLAEINIKKFQLTAENGPDFVALHTQMSQLCQALIQHRHFFIVDRVAQFVAVIRDLLQSVCWYHGAKQDRSLENGEITMLADLSHNMENILKTFVKHAKMVKRVAPYLLIFVMDLMISNEKPTTLFPKIKTHFEGICYDLISVCDHRVEGFIMRNCNEASKQLYEQLMKDFNKYHKFKGKV